MQPLDDLGISLSDIADDPLAPPAAVSEPRPPAIIERLPADAYHADITSVGIHGLALVGRSPLHHWWHVRRPGREPEEPTPSQRLGSAVHVAVLEPERFDAAFAVAPDVDRRTKDGKARHAEFVAESAGKQIITAADRETALAVADRVRVHPMGKQLLYGAGVREASIYWTDPETGVRCRMRPDFAPDEVAFLVDLKSCTDAAETAFARSAWNYGYQLTAAWYLDGWKALIGEKREYVFVAWEKDPPYAAAFYYAESDTIQAGRHEYRRLLRTYAECLASDDWPGYPSQLMPFWPPAWAMDKHS